MGCLTQKVDGVSGPTGKKVKSSRNQAITRRARGQQGSLVCMDKGSTKPAREFDPRLTSKSCFPGNLINPVYNTR